MTTQIRPITVDDIDAAGNICYNAFKGIAEKHNFRPDFPDLRTALSLFQSIAAAPGVFGVVAEENGVVVGSNFLSELDEIRAVGPITVNPLIQSKGVGRKLMEAVIERGREAKGIRLVQDAFNSASLSLYASLGFEVKEPLALIEGIVQGTATGDVEVRMINDGDFEACADLCRSTHGFDRLNELKHTPPFLNSFVAVRDGRIVAYASAPHFWAVNHAVAESHDDMTALLTGVSAIGGQPLSFLMPTRQAALFSWALKSGLRVLKPMTLMAMGEYDQPAKPYLPSVGY